MKRLLSRFHNIRYNILEDMRKRGKVDECMQNGEYCQCCGVHLGESIGKPQSCSVCED